MNCKQLAVFFVVFHVCNSNKPVNQTAIVAAKDEEPPLPPSGKGTEGPTRAVNGFIDYDILKSKITWQRELKGNGRGTYLQVPANRLPSKFKPNHKYYLGFGSPDWTYGGCQNGVPCRFLEHCKPTAKFFNSFATFAGNACPIGNDFIGVCCNTETTSTPKIQTTTMKTPKSTSTKPNSSAGDTFKCGQLDRFIQRIVGGEPAEKDDWPWMAAILDSKDKDQFCGGVLISDKHVLTAAHCLRKVRSPSDILVRLGEYDLSFSDSSEKDFHVRRMKVHEQYIPTNTQLTNDIALLTLSTSVKFSKSIRHICLPQKNMVVEEINAFVTGWGTTRFRGEGSNLLMELYLPTWKQSECSSSYARFGQRIEGTQLCAGFKAGGRDSCQGDSGGPLMTMSVNKSWSVIGIVSYGKGCAQANTPGVYTRVSSYIDWIQRNARS